MAYNKVPATMIRSAIKQYGAKSLEHNSILLVADARLPYESIAELLLISPESVKDDLSGDNQLPKQEHGILHNCLNKIIPLGIERGLLPCKDNALSTEILRVLVEILGLKNQISDLQNQLQNP
jgi:hypothetical protein|nr:MAG TPA: hypothetical protein [Caudoviricetes sp.]